MTHKFLIVLFLFQGLMALSQEDKKDKKEKKGFYLFNNDTTEIPKNLYLWGKVLEKGIPLAGATVIVYRDGIKRDLYRTDSHGFFDVYLDFGFMYNLEFGKPGYVPKILEVETENIPMMDRDFGYETGNFQVEIFRSVKEVDFSIYKKPVGKIYYSVNNQQFVYDRRYIAKMKKETAAVEEEVALKLEDLESDDAYNKDKYDVYVRDGKIEFDAEDYSLSKTYFLEALKLYPEEEYPQKLVAKIDSIQNRFEAAEQIKMQLFLAKADSSFDLKNYANAVGGYSTVLNLDPLNDYAKKRLEDSRQKLAAENERLDNQLANTPKLDKIDISSIEINTNYLEKSKEIARKYPQGITKEEYKQGNKIVYLMYVVQGGKGVEYKRVKHNWGGEYFFRNEESIPQFQYNKETLADK